VIYASVNTTTEPEVKDVDGNVAVRKQSVTKSLPIGTIRLVPFPHPPHPEPGSSYVADTLETGPASHNPPPYIFDRPTIFHDGKEPYIKLGRIAVLKEFRGNGLSNLLANSALTWAKHNPTFFNPSVKEMGMENIGALSIAEIPIWKGLVCVHAQEQVQKQWAKWGFVLDEGMGTWVEEGINHIGMFQRLDIEDTP
jgi:predicted GNAT family N-acyltransferase